MLFKVKQNRFLTKNQVLQLRQLTKKINVICYGLLKNSSNEQFEGSTWLMNYADECKEFVITCMYCPSKASVNAKFCTKGGNKVYITHGNASEPDIGGDEKYEQLCYHCYAELTKN